MAGSTKEAPAPRHPHPWSLTGLGLTRRSIEDVEEKRMKRALLLLGALALVAFGGFTAVQTGSANSCGGGQVTEEQPGDAPAVAVTAPAAPLAPLSASACQGPPPDNAPDGIFLCYSKFQVLPGVWQQDQAAELLAQGYWYPNAVKGNVEGGPNLGAYHLVCNATGTPTGMFVNQNGEVFGPDYVDDNLGNYPLLS
jgi:hypothetical protein